MNKKTLLTIIIILAIALLVFLLSGSPAVTPAPAEDSTAVITQDLEGLDLGDLETEFQDVNADLNTL